MKQTFKKLSAFMMALAISGTLFAQVPQKFNYQGIARDTKGNPMAQQRMTLKLTVLPTADATTGEYEEIQTVTTNEFGLYTLQIGNGTPVAGEMKAVKWETGNKYIKVAIDPKGGNDFVDAGTNQLLSVPYAIYADKAGMAKTAGGDRTGAVNSAAGHVAGDANYLTKFTGLNVIGKSLVFDNGVGVGIGTNAPIAGSTMHLKRTTNGNHLYMENPTATAFGAFRMINDVPANFFTFSKYGSTYPGGYTGIATLYPFANILGMGNNGPFLNASTGNMGMAITKAGTNKLKFHIHASTERIGIGGSSVPAAQVHFNNTDAGNDTIKFTNNTTGHLVTDGTEIRTSGNNTRIINRENGYTILGTNNTDRLAIDGTGNVGIGTTTPSTRLDVNGQVRIQGGAPGAGKVLTSDATGLATWSTPSITSVGGNTDYIPKYTPNGTTLGNSKLQDITTGFSGLELKYNSGYSFGRITNYAPNGGYSGFVTADSATIFSGGYSDSISFLLHTPQNHTIIGNDNSNLLIGANSKLQVQPGFQNSTGNAQLNVITSYDTAGHFTSSSTNGLYNGILRAEYTGSTSLDHVAIYGKSTPSSSYGIGMKGEGNWYGVHGISNNGSTAIYGEGLGSATGVAGYSLNGVAIAANSGYASNPNAIAVNAFAAGNKGVGVRALADSNQAGVFTAGNANSSPALNNGILRGEYTGTYTTQDAVGVYGKSLTGTFYGIGVKGEGDWYGVNGVSNNYFGVYGQGNYGVYGIGNSGSTSTRYGVYGTASGATNNFAGYFAGTLYATTLTGGTKPFTIDHPLDPTNKYLRHSSIESNDMMNLYNGNITTDANGYATVEMPDYFEALNENFKYQLTVIGTFAQAIIKDEISNNKFVIQTSQPNVKVSWQVSGVRHDAVAKKYPVVVEEMKPEGQKGFYLEPEAFGQPKEMGANNPERIKKEKNVTTDFDYKADTQRLIEKAKADDAEMKRRKELQQEAQKNWKQQEAPKNTTKGTSGALAPTK